jgi:anthranilate synthase/aminodeoxychorismate synthase-like glutamine amidotransferase
MNLADRTLVVDNLDSFTWNLVAVLRTLGDHPQTRRADERLLAELATGLPSRVLISPGPKSPQEATVALAVIRHCLGRRPIYGVCLGHQCLASILGFEVQPLDRPVHGRTSLIEHDGRGLFSGVGSPMTVARYHSLGVLAPEHEARISAWTDEGGQKVVMGIRDETLALEGVQFHPESFMTPNGSALLQAFLAW